MKNKTYATPSEMFLSIFHESMQYGEFSFFRDVPVGTKQPIQTFYLNEVMGFFLRTLVKVYSSEPLSDKDRANLKRYFSKVIEAKDAIDGKGIDGRTY